MAPMWLWCRLAAAARIQPLAWELPCATGVALKKKEKKKKKNPTAVAPVPGVTRFDPWAGIVGKKDRSLQVLEKVTAVAGIQSLDGELPSMAKKKKKKKERKKLFQLFFSIMYMYCFYNQPTHLNSFSSSF